MRRAPSIRPRPIQRRGVAAVCMVITLLLVSMVVVASVVGGARDQDLTVRRLETLRAFYAAESGANMAIRELMVAADADADGTIGSISNDGNDNNDPTISSARVNVARTIAGGQSTLTSRGRCGSARRTVEAVWQ